MFRERRYNWSHVSGINSSSSCHLVKKYLNLRPFQGAQHVAGKVRGLLKDSGSEYHKDCDKVQDPYSVRCIPQVHGASWDAFYHLERMVNIELNSITDNPIVLKDGDIVSGGNFMDDLAIPIDYNIMPPQNLEIFLIERFTYSLKEIRKCLSFLLKY